MAFGEKCGSTQQQPALSAPDAAQLSEMRYRGGAASYLEVLTNETNYFNAELGLAQAQSNELVALIRIYRNLDGGWQTIGRGWDWLWLKTRVKRIPMLVLFFVSAMEFILERAGTDLVLMTGALAAACVGIALPQWLGNNVHRTPSQLSSHRRRWDG
jgi:hypothetical protein